MGIVPSRCRIIRNLTVAGIAILVAAGCSESNGPAPREIVRAQGTLTYRGRPVPEAQLTFRGDDPSEPAFAVTDSNGRFRCMTNDSSDGMPPGEYVVTISSPRGGVPEKYTDAETSPLWITVEVGAENDFPIELED
jgi:hypothetical protein